MKKTIEYQTAPDEVTFSPENYREYVAGRQSHIVVTSEEDLLGARVLCTDRKGTGRPVVVLLEKKDREGREWWREYPSTGQFGNEPSECDLRIVPKPPVVLGWVVLYKCQQLPTSFSGIFASLDELRDAVHEEHWLSQPVQFIDRPRP